MKKIVVIGSTNTDMVIKTDRMPNPGETVLGGQFFMNPGGKGANQAVAAARLGGNVVFISKTGNDVFGRQSIELYNQENINTSYIYTDPKNPCGIALITVDGKGENSIVVATGANASLKPKEIFKAKSEIESADIVLMQLEIPIDVAEFAAEIAGQSGVKVVLNPAPAQEISSEFLKHLYAITPNRSEAEILSGCKVTDLDSAKEAARIIAAKGCGIVVITLGAWGALVLDNGSFEMVKAHEVEAIDTTAAGDVFNGALCVAVAEGKSMIDAVRFACKASEMTVMRMGARSAIPYRKEVDRLMKN